jgi:hypothetical protein
MTATVLHIATAGLFSYEAIALCSNGRLPTISALVSRNHWLVAAAAVVLVIHLERDAASAAR